MSKIIKKGEVEELLGCVITDEQFNEALEYARKKQESIEDLCHAVVKAATACKKELEDALYACTDHYFYERCSLYKEKAGLFSFDFTEPSYGAFCKRLDEYLGSLDREIATLGYGDIPMPPRMEETEGV